MKRFIKSHFEIICFIPAIIAFLTFCYSMMTFGNTILAPDSYTVEAQQLIQVSGIAMLVSFLFIFVAIGCGRAIISIYLNKNNEIYK